jgi:hypothetical protein
MTHVQVASEVTGSRSLVESAIPSPIYTIQVEDYDPLSLSPSHPLNSYSHLESLGMEVPPGSFRAFVDDAKLRRLLTCGLCSQSAQPPFWRVSTFFTRFIKMYFNLG